MSLHGTLRYFSCFYRCIVLPLGGYTATYPSSSQWSMCGLFLVFAIANSATRPCVYVFATFLELISKSKKSVSKDACICNCVRYRQVPFHRGDTILHTSHQYIQRPVFLGKSLDNRVCGQTSRFYQTDRWAIGFRHSLKMSVAGCLFIQFAFLLLSHVPFVIAAQRIC